MNTDRKSNNLEEKCSVLAETVIAIRPVYNKANPTQKAFLETVIGAAIWYIPKPTSAWTGKISIGALRMYHPESGVTEPKLSEEHVFPRKITARLLFNDQSLTEETLVKLFLEKYGLLHLITPDENKSVQQFQRVNVFTTPENAYLEAGIILISVDKNDLQFIKRRDRFTIEKYL